MGGARREGRPWSGAKGPVPAINAVAELLHQYMAEARLSLKDVHDKLAPEYFPPGTDLPTPRQFYDLLDGKKLTLEVACAVIDICSGPDGDARIDAKRRDEVGELFRQAAREPRPSFRDLVTASEKMLSLRTSLQSLQTAYEESTAARDTAQVVAVAMFGLLQQMQNTVSHLTRQRDQLRAEAEKQPVLSGEVQRLQDQLDQAQQRERDTQELLDTALKDKASADRTANEAAVLIATQEAEIRRLKAAAEAAREALPAGDHMPLGVSEPVAFSVELNVNQASDEAGMAQADAMVLKARVLLEQGRQAVAASQERIAEAGTAGTLVVYPPVTEPPSPPLYGTTAGDAVNRENASFQSGPTGGNEPGRHRFVSPRKGTGERPESASARGRGAAWGPSRYSGAEEWAPRSTAVDAAVLAILILALCAYTSVTVVIALPVVRHDLLSRFDATAPMIISNLLAAAVTTGWGRDAALRYGPRRVLVPGLLLLAAGSLTASWAPAYESTLDPAPASVVDWSLVQLMTGCVLQGLGEGLCVGAAGCILSGSRGFPWPQSRTKWALAAGSAIAVAASGLVLSTWVWRIGFQVPAVTALVLLLTLPLVSGRGQPRAPRPDTWLMLLTAAANGAFVWAIEIADTAFWLSVLVVLAVGGLALLGCALRLKMRESVEEGDSVLWVPAIWAWVSGAVQCTAWLYSVVALQQVFHYGAWTAACLLLLAVPPVVLALYPGAVFARLRPPARLIGFLATASGLLWLSGGLSDPETMDFPALAGALALVGAGTAVLRCPPSGLSLGGQRSFDGHTKYGGALATALSTTLIVHTFAIGSRTGGTEARQADAYATVLTICAAVAIAAALVGALTLVRWRHAAATPSSGPDGDIPPRHTAGPLATTVYVITSAPAPTLTGVPALIAGAGNRAALFSQPGPSTLALILYCLIGLCVLAAIAAAAIALTTPALKRLDGPNSPNIMIATTIASIPIGLIAGNFITDPDMVAAGTWIATTAGLM
ncbi:hypothetical protein ACFXG6_32840 [Streptomyces roseus]|uniref:hypothetical protein n=1 Tax=Streptomyces roseus TaxID=66430 RepID=UPI0036B26345